MQKVFAARNAALVLLALLMLSKLGAGHVTETVVTSAIIWNADVTDVFDNFNEECDDGNQDNTDACTVDCTDAVCGDDFLQAGVEECDDGNLINGDGCSATCTNEP